MVVVGAHFLLRCLDLEWFILYVVKEFEPLIQKPYTIVYFLSAASLQTQPDLGRIKGRSLWIQEQNMSIKGHRCISQNSIGSLNSAMGKTKQICETVSFVLQDCIIFQYLLYLF